MLRLSGPSALRPFLALALSVAAASCGAPQSGAPAPAAPPAAGSAAAPSGAPSGKPDSAAGPAAAAAPLPPSLRLPDTFAPTEYAVELTIDPASDHFRGDIRIAAKVLKPTDVLWLNGNGLSIKQAKLHRGGDSWAIQPLAVTGEDFLGFGLGKSVEPGEVSIEIQYEGRIVPNQMSGVFQQKDGELPYVYTQFESISAREAFPCFDEPGFKVPWQLSITVPDGQLAFSNTAVEKESGGDGVRIFQFAKTRPIPSYLVAFAVGPFEIVDVGRVGRNKVPTRVIVPRGHTAEAATAVATLPHLVEQLEAYFDMPLPYDKMDHVAVPQFFGAMENPGMITYAAGILLNDPHKVTPKFERELAGIAAHELAHQWFGDLVTMTWWDDIWLNESFATWMAAKVVQGYRPAWLPLLEHQTEVLRAMASDSLISARRIHNPVVGKGDIEGSFDAISYGKGGGVLSMFERWVGADRFRDGVRAYMRKHAWGNASSSDFLDAIAAVSDPEVPSAFATFLDQPGVPLLSVSLRCDKGAPPRVTVKQERFLPLGSQGGAAQAWKVPVCLRYGAGGKPAEQCALLTSTSTDIDLAKASRCPDWLTANAAGAGYYRVAYRGDLGQKLLAAGKQLAVSERLTLANDLGALVGAGRLAAADVLATIPVLSRDPDGHILSELVDLLSKVEDSQLVPEASRPGFQRFVRKTFAARARQIGWRPRKGEADDVRQVRGKLLALVAEVGQDQALLAEAEKMTRAWLDARAQPAKPGASGAADAVIAPEMLDRVLPIGTMRGDAALYDRVLGLARATTDNGERRALLIALGSFRDPALVQRSMDLFVESSFDLRQASELLKGPMGHPETRDGAWQSFKSHWDAIKAKVPVWVQGYLIFTGAAFCDQAHRDDVAAFFGDKVGGISNGDRSLKQTLEIVDLCVAKREATSASVAEFLSKY